MRHEHHVKVNWPVDFDDLSEKVEDLKEHIEEHRVGYLFGVSVVVGFLLGRRRPEPTTTVVIVVTELDQPVWTQLV